jgi:hypothetical protein
MTEKDSFSETVAPEIQKKIKNDKGVSFGARLGLPTRQKAWANVANSFVIVAKSGSC